MRAAQMYSSKVDNSAHRITELVRGRVYDNIHANHNVSTEALVVTFFIFEQFTNRTPPIASIVTEVIDNWVWP